jgi:Kef-type K+ transport system membrane component KefB
MIVSLLIVLVLVVLMHAARSFGAPAGSGTLLVFGYLMLASFFTGNIASRLGLPKLTGYLLLGVISGPHVLALIGEPESTSLEFVSNSAICIIALTAGSELNFKRIRPVMPTLRAITLYAVVGAMFALAAMLFAMRPFLPFLDRMSETEALAVCAVIGVALSAQSPAVVMALLSETRADGPLSHVMLGSVVLADLAVITMYAVASTVASSVSGGGADVAGMALSVSWHLFGSIAFGFATGMAIGYFLRTVTRGAVLFALMVCIVVAEIGARVHLDPLIVMLAAGIWLENVSRANAHDLLHEIESARLPLFLVFFALAGSHIDVGELTASILPVAILALARAAFFWLGSAVACRLTRPDPVVRQYAWFGLVPQSGLALALALLVQQSFPEFGNAAAAIVFGVIGLNELVSPVILRVMILRSGEAGKKAASDLVVSAADRAA